MNVRDIIPQGWTRNLPWWRNRDPQTPAQWREEGRDPFAAFHREVDRLFDSFFQSFGARLPASPGFGPVWGGSGAWPSVEISETGQAISVTAELPGLEEKDVELLLEDGLLTLRGEKTSSVEDRDRQFSERVYGRFERRIPLPSGIDEAGVEASFRNGVLTVTLPKTADARERVRRIPLKT